MMSGKFVLKSELARVAEFHFNLLASNGEIIATSKHYERKASARKGIKSVQSNAASATIEDETED